MLKALAKEVVSHGDQVAFGVEGTPGECSATDLGIWNGDGGPGRGTRALGRDGLAGRMAQAW